MAIWLTGHEKKLLNISHCQIHQLSHKQSQRMTPIVEKMNIPSEFYCPITCEVMRDPLMCRSGTSFERSAILLWLEQHNKTCPLTRKPLRVSDLVPNRALQGRIQAFFANSNLEDLDDNPRGHMLVTCLISSMAEKVTDSKQIATRRWRDMDTIIADARAKQMSRISSMRR
jgi:hypothetical protein